nr:hypothetical protein [Geodermatophilus amargosae]
MTDVGMSRSHRPCSPGAQGVTPVASVRATMSARCSGPTSSATARTSTLHPLRVRRSISSTSKVTSAWSAAVSLVRGAVRMTTVVLSIA